MFQDRKAFAVGINCYVPAMSYSGSAGISLGPVRHSLGAPATAGTIATLIPNQGVTLLAISYLSAPLMLDAVYGRNITLTPSGVPGTNNITEVLGYDYLGQPMFERFTGASAATTPLVGARAFKWVIGTRVVLAASNVVTSTIATGVLLGLPWKGSIIAAKEDTTNMSNAQITTNFTAAVLTDPQTNATGDPRGLYSPTTAPNGTLREVTMVGDPWVNAAGNGGLLGIRHLAF